MGPAPSGSTAAGRDGRGAGQKAPNQGNSFPLGQGALGLSGLHECAP